MAIPERLRRRVSFANLSLHAAVALVKIFGDAKPF
jgi:hypothetical protein